VDGRDWVSEAIRNLGCVGAFWLRLVALVHLLHDLASDGQVASSGIAWIQGFPPSSFLQWWIALLHRRKALLQSAIVLSRGHCEAYPECDNDDFHSHGKLARYASYLVHARYRTLLCPTVVVYIQRRNVSRLVTSQVPRFNRSTQNHTEALGCIFGSA
jgi:hypothetical protein